MGWRPVHRLRKTATEDDGIPDPAFADLIDLGADTLAAILLERAATDGDLLDRLRLTVAARTGPDCFASAVAGRIQALANDDTFYRWDEAATMATRIDDLRHAIADELLEQVPQRAADLLGALVKTSDTNMEQVDDSSGVVGAAYDEAIDAWGAAWAAVPARDPDMLAALVLEQVHTDDYGLKRNVITAFSDALEPAGLEALRRLIESELANANPNAGPYQQQTLRLALRQVADGLGDVDGFIAAVEADGQAVHQAVEIAVRLVGANRPQAALDWLDRSNPAEWDMGRTADIRVAALLALDQTEEAQTVRWRQATEGLNIDHYRAFIAAEPASRHSAARNSASSAALAHSDAEGALEFLFHLPDLDAAERLVIDRYRDFDGAAYYTLQPLAARLENDRPLASALLYRILAEAILDARRSPAYHHAADYLCIAARLATRLADWHGHEHHDAFMDRLREVHRRKTAFWPALAAAEQNVSRPAC
jgi:hypothetical protein